MRTRIGRWVNLNRTLNFLMHSSSRLDHYHHHKKRKNCFVRILLILLRLSTKFNMTSTMEQNLAAWVDDTWLETLVVIGITCFILCLMKLSKVSTAKMGMLYGMIGMTLLIFGFWFNTDYNYAHGRWVIAASIAPGFFIGIISAIVVEITTLPELVGAYVSLISFIYGYTFRASITRSLFSCF